ncbi:MAG: inorganic diphosphatase [Candidatus Paceibacterota bacterium]
MNLWHDIDPGTADEMNAVIEIPKGSHNKYEIDKETGMLALDRANYGSAPYPFEYGFIPKTYWDDGDALDVVLLATFPIPSGMLVRIRPVAFMEMIDAGENDYKIIGVPIKDKRWDDVHDLADINKHTLKEIKNFFETYKDLKGETVTVPSFKGAADAKTAFERGRKLYDEKFAK